MLIEKIDESFYRVHTDYDIMLSISEYFSFYADNYRWHPKYKAGAWDGKIRLFNIRESKLPQGLLPLLLEWCEDNEIDYQLDTYEVEIDPKILIDTEMELRYFQENAINKVLKEKKCGIVLPTGSGKSLFQYGVITSVRAQHPDAKTLMVVPNVSLVEQMCYDFKDYSVNDISEDIHMIYAGQDKDVDVPIVISTWQSLMNMPKKWFEQFDILLVDEFHGAVAKEVDKIVNSCTNAAFKVGASGTLRDSKVNNLMLQGLFGNIHKIIDTKTLMEEGYLTNAKILNYVLNYPKWVGKAYRKLMRDSKKEKRYHAERSLVVNIPERTEFIGNLGNHLKDNALILFKTVKYGKKIVEELEKRCNDKQIYFVSGEVKPKHREEIRQLTEKSDNVIIVATTQIFSTGINIKRLHYVIFSQPSKSKIQVLQSIGRGLRLHESKSKVTIIDLVDNFNKDCYSMRHAVGRLEVYEDEQFDYSVKEVSIKAKEP